VNEAAGGDHAGVGERSPPLRSFPLRAISYLPPRSGAAPAPCASFLASQWEIVMTRNANRPPCLLRSPIRPASTPGAGPPLARGSGARIAAVLLAFAGLGACSDGGIDEAPDAPSSTATPAYEVWAIDQGTHVVHIFDDRMEEIDRIDLGAHGVQVPHMLEFTSDHRYAFVAAPATGNVAVIRTGDREVLGVIPTGPRTHHAAVSPDDRRVLVSVIGAPDVDWDGKLVEIDVDLAREEFRLGRELTVAQDPLFAEHREAFRPGGGAVCLAFTADGGEGWVTLGPGLDEGGVVVVDMESFTLRAAHPPDEVEANCGTILSRTGEHMFLVGGDREVGVWHAMDTGTRERVHRGESMGHDAHGSWLTPDGSEYWMVNRVTSNAIVIDTETLEVIEEIPFVGKTPDIVAMSPDGLRAFITLRGPNPVTMPHVAVGETPGFAVIDVEARELLRLVEPARGNDASDFHAIAVRPVP
jgi:DNA-binding beta-propeller fold protein YncE